MAIFQQLAEQSSRLIPSAASFSRPSYREAEVSGRPNNVPENVNVKHPLI
jgi:hypothetical protein